jgi:uncharacterized Zn finger protein
MGAARLRGGQTTPTAVGEGAGQINLCALAAQERARREREQAAARARHLDSLAGREPELWQRVDALIEMKRPAEYDQAVQLLQDLHDLGARSGQGTAFAARLSALRERHARKPSLLQRLDQAGLGT